MKRPTQSGLIGALMALLFLASPYTLPLRHKKRTIVLYCNRHLTNIQSLIPDPPLPHNKIVAGTQIREPMCMLYGRKPLLPNSPAPLLLSLSYCEARSPLEVGTWQHIVPGNIWVNGRSLRLTNEAGPFELGVYFKEYIVILKQ